MKYHRQQQFTCNEKGESGSCLQTTYACLLDLELYQVPPIHLFYLNANHKTNLKNVLPKRYITGDKSDLEYNRIQSIWWDIAEVFLAMNGYTEEHLSPEDHDEWIKGNKDVYYIASGDSPRGDWKHVVIYQNGKMVHDPHFSDEGLKKVNYYRYLVKHEPS